MTNSRDLGLKIVSIGGGTGLSTLLSGLKRYVGHQSTRPSDPSLSASLVESLTAIVTVTDDGGSSGRLREEFQILPPGDIRNCLAALAEDELLLTRLFQYRFESDGDLSGHSFGNIFLTALTGVTGDFVEAIKLTSEVLAIKGRIFPSTREDVTLIAELAGGRIVEGESRIVDSRSHIKSMWLSRKDCQPLPEAVEAVRDADLITIGPGSLYTSIVPNLLVTGIVDAICQSNALKVYICNVMTQPGETQGFSVEDHVRTLYQYSPKLELDYVVVNSASITSRLKKKYFAEGAIQVGLDAGLERRGDGFRLVDDPRPDSLPGFRIINGDLLNQNDVVRHDPHKLARLLLETCGRHEARDGGPKPGDTGRQRSGG
ncbi:MAG TPA: YvcK family protein [Blastocatellia bacterium]|nr:YvcK family protein [Blastocatellia bacterium]